MCGRTRMTVPGDELARLFRVDDVLHALPPRLEVRPTDPIAVVRRGPDGRRKLEVLRWGIVPRWAKDPRSVGALINARVETVADKPAFRDSLRSRRCLVVADAFYEWKKDGATKTPYVVTTRAGGAFAMAGLWDRWVAIDGEVLESCTVITREANGVVAELHDRMPIVLAEEHHEAWLDPDLQDAALAPLLASGADVIFVASPTSPVRQLGLFG